MELKVHHVGYAVPDIAKALAEFAVLGWTHDGVVTEDPDRQVRIAFMRLSGQCVELVAPLTGESPIVRTLQRGSGAPYHICYEVENLEAAEAELKGKGFIVFKKPAPAPAIGNRRVEFLFARQVGTIELLESPDG